MKISKKLIAAIGMLMLSTVMLVTSSFAWFSMNEKVEVTNMQVKAVSNQVYLEISKGDFNNEVLTAINENTVINDCLPINVYESITDGSKTDLDGDSESFVWGTASGTNISDASAKDGKYTEVAEFTNAYGYKSTYKLRLNPNAGATDANGPLWATVTISGADYESDKFSNCVSVLIVCGDKMVLYKQASPSANATELTAKIGEDLTDGAFPKYDSENIGGTVKTVNVYVFFDGDNANCTTANAKVSGTYSIDIAFSVGAKA